MEVVVPRRRGAAGEPVGRQDVGIDVIYLFVKTSGILGTFTSLLLTYSVGGYILKGRRQYSNIWR
ncbi:MAG: hypothetical protein ACYTEL_23145 [Planctomycetota bacterium]